MESGLFRNSGQTRWGWLGVSGFVVRDGPKGFHEPRRAAGGRQSTLIDKLEGWRSVGTGEKVATERGKVKMLADGLWKCAQGSPGSH